MLALSAPFAAMVEGVEQTYAYRVGISLPGGIYPDVTLTVDELSIDQSITSDLPDGSRLIEGYPSAQATFTLAGMVDPTDETKTAKWLFNPYSVTSPLYRSDAFRSPVTIDLGLIPSGAAGTPELARKFSGYVDSYTVTEEGTVQFTCIDKRTDLRSVPQLPAVVTAPPYNAGLTSEFAIDYLLRAATNKQISSWEPTRTGCLVAAGMRSSIWPEIGAISIASAVPVCTFAPGVNGTGLSNTSTGYVAYTATDLSLFDLGTGAPFTVELSFLGNAAILLIVGSANALQIDISSTGVRFRLFPGGGAVIDDYTWTTPISAGAHKLSFSFDKLSSNSWSATMRLDGVTNSTGSRTASGTAIGAYGGIRLYTTAGTVMSGVQVTSEASDLSLPTFTPNAVLDPSLNVLQTIPAITDGDPWQTIQQIAQAELGAAGYLADPDTFRFYNRNRLRGGAVARTITAATSLQEFGIEVGAASVVNRARVGYTNWTYAAAMSTVYSAEAPILVPRNGNQTMTVTLDSLATQIDTTVVVLPNNSTDTANSYYRASNDIAGRTAFTGSLIFTVYQSAPDSLTVTIANPTGADAWLVSPASYTDITVGTPLLRIAGISLTPNNEQIADWQYPPAQDGGAAGTRFGEVVHEISGNPWIQDGASALQLATDIVCESSHPIPNFTGMEIVPDPRLQIADRVLIQDPYETGVNEYARIFAISITLSSNDDGTASYSMTIDARAITFPGGWILGVTGRSELGVTTWI